MLRIFEGSFTSEAHNELIAEVSEAVKAGKRTYLFVPEQQTLLAEREMCECLPSSAPLIFEVTNFTRFTNTAFRSLGGISKKYCTGAQEALFMWQTLTELSAMLSMTRGKRRISAGIVTKALGAVKEAQSQGLTPDMLAEAEKIVKGTDTRLSAKLSDLSLIYGMYKRLLGEKYSTITDDLMALADALEENPEFLSGCEIFIDGFTSFTEGQYRLIGRMMRVCTVTVALTIPVGGEGLFEYQEPAGAKRRLIRIADKLDCEKKIRRIGTPDPTFCPTVCELGRLLWRTEGRFDNDCLQIIEKDGERVRIFEAQTPFDECDFLAADIQRRVMEGAEYSDFAIVARRAESYVGILDTALSDASIPHFISKRRDICTLEAIKLISTAYAIVCRGFMREDVITYAKCGLCGISKEACDIFELYTEKWSIDGYRFTDESPWNMSPAGYRGISDTDGERLRYINSVREALITPLLRFRDEVREAATVREHATALIKYLCELGIEEALARRAEELSALGESAAAEENSRLWGIICSALDTVVDTLGDFPADGESFISQLSAVFSQIDIGRIPSVCDEVTVGSADMLRAERKKHVYLIGVNDGEFPAAITDSSYFNDRERSLLSSLGLTVEAETGLKSAREYYCFTRALTLGTDTVTFMYTRRSAAMSAQLPDNVIGRICDICAERIKPVSIDTLPLWERIYTPSGALMHASEASDEEYSRVREVLSARGLGDLIEVSNGSLNNSGLSLSADTLGLIYKDELYLSQTKLDKFLCCPFSYFCQYNLGLSENERAELNAAVIGSFIHSILENFFRIVKERDIDLGGISSELKEEIAAQAAESYIRSTLSGSEDAVTDWAIKRLCRASAPVIDGLCEEFAGSRFVPTFFELPIGRRSAESPDPIIYTTRDGTRAIIKGIVDRVDTYKADGDVYVRVVDYKTGQKKFSPGDMAQGENLQMFLYLKAITDTDDPDFKEGMGVGVGGRLIPAGVIYMGTSVKDTTVRSASDDEAKSVAKELSVRMGMVLDDEKSLAAMNPDFLPRNSDKRSDFKYSAEGWEQIGRDIESAVLDIVEGMKSGDICASPRPMRSPGRLPCDFCSFKAVCRSAK